MNLRSHACAGAPPPKRLRVAAVQMKFAPGDIGLFDYKRLYLEMNYTRLVDNFLVYITQLTAEMLTKHRRALSSDEQVRVADVRRPPGRL